MPLHVYKRPPTQRFNQSYQKLKEHFILKSNVRDHEGFEVAPLFTRAFIL